MDDGALLAEVGAIPAPDTVQLPQWLWESSDGGVHWGPLATPDGAATFSVRQPRAGEPWRICGLSALSTPSGPRNLWCTTDGGHRWALQPGFTVPGECTGTSCLIPLMLSDVSMLQLADNGDILLRAWTGVLRAGATEQLTGIGLYRLPAGSNRWQFLGPLDTSLFYVSSPGSGTLWGYVGDTTVGSRLAGSIGGQTDGPNPLAGKVIVAPYKP